MNKYVIIGPPGAGKSTQAERLCRTYGLVRISLGDILRWNIKNHTKLAAKLRYYIDSGRLVPDDTVEQVLRDRLQQHDWNYGFVLDGYPATKTQAETFLQSYDIDGVILLDVPDSTAQDRLGKNQVCTSCGIDYQLVYNEPRVERVCDICGGPLQDQSKEAPELIPKRLHEYRTKTEPVIEIFQFRELLVSIDGSQSPDAVHAAISRELGLGLGQP